MSRAFFWRHPEWWTVLLAICAWCWLGVSWLDPHSAHHPFRIPSEALHWAAMTAGMMFPIVLGHVSLIAQRSLWRRRHRAIAVFLAAYLTLWVLYGLAISAVFHWSVRLSAGMCLLLAALWQLTPWKRLALLGCHRTVPLAPAGWHADRDCLRYGCSVARNCVLNCWPLMMACAAARHSPWLIVALTVFLLKERTVLRAEPRYFAFALLTGAVLSLEAGL